MVANEAGPCGFSGLTICERIGLRCVLADHPAVGWLLVLHSKRSASNPRLGKGWPRSSPAANDSGSSQNVGVDSKPCRSKLPGAAVSETTQRLVRCEDYNVMNIHFLNQICLVCVFSAALASTVLAQGTSKEEELQRKETELQKKEDDLDRQRRELEDARKQLRLEETAQSVTIRLEGDVLFDTGKAQLRPEAQSALEKVAVVLAQFPDSNVEIAGHTDSKGGSAMNLDLSKKRAAAVSEFLKKRSELAKINFTTQGFGETRPIASNDTDEGRLQNRRVEIVVEKQK
jgi:outer membrane protein OmpA-like peptidoglycan-associated protein